MSVVHMDAVEIKDGDTIFFTTPHSMTYEQGLLLKERVSKEFPKCKFIIMSDGMEIHAVVRNASPC